MDDRYKECLYVYSLEAERPAHEAMHDMHVCLSPAEKRGVAAQRRMLLAQQGSCKSNLGSHSHLDRQTKSLFCSKRRDSACVYWTPYLDA